MRPISRCSAHALAFIRASVAQVASWPRHCLSVLAQCDHDHSEDERLDVYNERKRTSDRPGFPRTSASASNPAHPSAKPSRLDMPFWKPGHRSCPLPFSSDSTFIRIFVFVLPISSPAQRPCLYTAMRGRAPPAPPGLLRSTGSPARRTSPSI